MKKWIVFGLTLLLSASSLNGQVFKLLGGFFTSNYKLAGNKQLSRMIPVVGIGLDSEFASQKTMMTIDFWISYHNQDFDFSNRTRHFNMLALNCDLLLKIKFKKNSSPYLLFGGYAGMISTRETDAKGESLAIEQPFKPLWDYGPVIGGGMEFLLSSRYALSIDGRYRLGVADAKLEGMSFKQKTLLMVIAIKF